MNIDMTCIPAAFSGNVDVNFTDSKTAWSTEREIA